MRKWYRICTGSGKTNTNAAFGSMWEIAKGQAMNQAKAWGEPVTICDYYRSGKRNKRVYMTVFPDGKIEETKKTVEWRRRAR